MYTHLFLRLVEMFHNIVHRISHALLYFRDTYFCKGNQTQEITTALILTACYQAQKTKLSLHIVIHLT